MKYCWLRRERARFLGENVKACNHSSHISVKKTLQTCYATMTKPHLRMVILFLYLQAVVWSRCCSSNFEIKSEWLKNRKLKNIHFKKFKPYYGQKRNCKVSVLRHNKANRGSYSSYCACIKWTTACTTIALKI